MFFLFSYLLSFCRTFVLFTFLCVPFSLFPIRVIQRPRSRMVTFICSPFPERTLYLRACPVGEPPLTMSLQEQHCPFTVISTLLSVPTSHFGYRHPASGSLVKNKSF